MNLFALILHANRDHASLARHAWMVHSPSIEELLTDGDIVKWVLDAVNLLSRFVAFSSDQNRITLASGTQSEFDGLLAVNFDTASAVVADASEYLLCDHFRVF